MEQKICQSCAMPMGDGRDLYGTNADGEKSADYCRYCYQNGAFTTDETMREMIETCIPFMAQGEGGMPPEEARRILEAAFPTLKRWKMIGS